MLEFRGSRSRAIVSGQTKTRFLSRAKRAVLLVDPASEAIQQVQGMLKGYDFDLLWAPDTERAHAILRSRKVSCVIANSEVADVDALDFIAEIRNCEDTHRTPVILVVGDTNAQQVLKARELGISEIIIRPVDATRLRKSLAKALFAQNN